MSDRLDLYAIEREYRASGYRLICGIDEAGRGPLAGPVYAAAVILPEGLLTWGINDSKKISEKKREALFPVICDQAEAWSVAFAAAEEIDEINIRQAAFLAMRRALDGLMCRPDLVLVDGNALFDTAGVPAKAVVGGDGRIASIAAASILAKVARDRHMTQMAERYPGYGFEQHKGYPTKAHYEAIKRNGPSPIHRKSFRLY